MMNRPFHFTNKDKNNIAEFQSGDVSDAVYESQWYLASGDISKQLLFLQSR